MKRLFTVLITLLIVILFFPPTLSAQNNESLWLKISKQKANQGTVIKGKSEPRNANFYQLNLNQLKAQLKNAPLRGASNKESDIIIQFPNAKGYLEAFKVMEAPVMAPELQAKHPDIKSYVGQSIENPSSTIRFSVTPLGLHTMTLSSKYGTQYIEPFTKDSNNYIVYSKHDLPKIDDDFVCEVTEGVNLSNRAASEAKLFNANDGNLRTYRLALACTLEYSEFIWMAAGYIVTDPVQDRKDAVLAAMNVTVARVSGIYERDLSIKLELIANNEDIIFIDTGPFTPTANDTANKLIDESQTQIDNFIGSANYDIGHTFSTGAGGLAGLGVVCLDGQKARGVTGSSSPVGDAFDVDYVAHEMGHQFGANHTFNGNASNCAGGNRNPSTAYEPGSGSTIMAYAGICTPQNVQLNSDDYFHQISLQEIWAHVTTDGACVSPVPTGNNAPSSNAESDYTIPVSTPYKLMGSSTDDDGTGTHTYTWEEFDLGVAGAPSESSLDSPLVRSFEGTSSPIRYIPRLTELRSSNGSTAWEKLSSVSRAVNFQLTVRDNDIRGGQTATDAMTVSVTDIAGPFLVTSQADGSSWTQNTTETITWNVAGTDAAPINVSNVNIWLSTDGGLTYNIPLASNTANDGMEDIMVPNVLATHCRVMVEAVNNIFFNINTVSFPIGYTIANTCVQYDSGNLGISIPDSGSQNEQGVAIGDIITVSDAGTITSVKVRVDVTHDYVSDLVIQVTHPDGSTQSTLWARDCDNENGIDIIFEDGSPTIVCPSDGTPASQDPIIGTFSPINPLNVFNDLDLNGDWQIAMADFYIEDTGTFNNWYLDICADIATPLGVEDFSFTDFSVFPNPNKGEFTVKLNSVSNNLQIEVIDMRGRSLFNNSYKNTTHLTETINLKSAQSGMYLVKVRDGSKIGVKKIVIK